MGAEASSLSAPGQADAPPRTAALPPLPAELKQPPPATAVPAKAQQLHVVPVLLQDSTGGAASSTSTDDVKHDQLQHRGSDAADSCVVGSPHVAPKTAAGGEVETAAVRQSSPTPASAAVAASDVSDSGNCTGGGSSAAATAAAEACSEDGGGRGEALAAIAATFKQAPNVAPAAEAVEAPAAAAAAGEAAAAAVEAQAAAAPAATANTATAPAAAEASAQAAPAADSTSYGAAAASLADPACRQGTPEFAAAQEANSKILAEYNSILQGLEAKQEAKPDMQAASKLLTRKVSRRPQHPRQYGHVPGVAVGAAFRGRGELDVLGLHTQMMAGINSSKQHSDGATAIILGGGYADDEDGGETFTYTGAGGQKNKRQVQDQSYENVGNAALVRNFETGTPVRVFRGQKGKPPVYSYEGLYKVVGHRMERSRDGPKVIRFTMQAVPGHSAVSAKVEYKCLQRASAFIKRQLAAADGDKQKAKRRKTSRSGAYTWDFEPPAAADLVQQIQARAKAGKCGRLVTADISGGQERVPIPVWNSVDSEDLQVQVPAAAAPAGGAGGADAAAAAAGGDITLNAAGGGDLNSSDIEPGTAAAGADALTARDQGPPAFGGFTYITEYRFSKDDEAERIAQQAAEAFSRSCPTTCGVKFHGGECPYNSEGLLIWNHPYGVMECGPDCRGMSKACKSKRHLCKRNRVVSEGIIYPLEVFKTEGRGWGVRCSVDIPVGAPLCCYIGNIMTDESADKLRGADGYLYDLSAFHALEKDVQQQFDGGLNKDPEANTNLPPIPAHLKSAQLVVDASKEGNVARFINHSCQANCVTQAVFLPNDSRSQLLHHVVIVATQDIPRFTELTYDYGSLYVISHEDLQAAQPDTAAAATADAAAAGGAAAAAAAADAAAAAAAPGGLKRRTRCTCGAEKCRGWLMI